MNVTEYKLGIFLLSFDCRRHTYAEARPITSDDIDVPWVDRWVVQSYSTGKNEPVCDMGLQGQGRFEAKKC